MNADRLLAHYERISNAPGANARLRQLILDLAVRGKLVPQDLEDEPASDLLNRIAEMKARLHRTGRIKGRKAISILSHAPFSIPVNWRWSSLAEIGVLSPRNEARDELRASFVPMPMIGAAYGVAHEHEQRPWGEIKKGYTHFAEGDVGLAKITPCFENGKSTVFRNLCGGIGSGTTELHIVRPLLVSPDYILLFLKSPQFIEAGIPRMTGTAGQKRLPLDYFANSPLPLPPLVEQRRIVAKVNELMALCDRLEAARVTREATRDRLTAASLARLNAPEPETFQADVRFALDAFPTLAARADQIKKLRQTILNLAVRGRLVSREVSDEGAADLLKRISSEKQQLIQEGKIKPLNGAKSEQRSAVSFEIPIHWCGATIQDVLYDLQTGPFGSALHQSDYQLGGTPVINPASIQDGAIVPIAKMAVGAATLKRLSSFRLCVGDIIMGRRGEMGRCALVTEREAGWLCGTGSLILRPSPLLHGPFLALLIGSPYGRGYLGSSAVGTTMQNLNQSILLMLAFGLPPLAEQHRIVAKVNELMALCDRLEVSLLTAAEARHRLLDAVLAEALAPAIQSFEVAA